MLYFTAILNSLLMLVMPLALGWWLARRFGARWSLFGAGAVAFVLAQAVHIPLNAGLTALFAQKIFPAPPTEWKLIFNATILGFTAGLWESLARYFVYRFWLKNARTWREGVMLGAGHGGIEAILVGVLTLVTVIQFIALRNADLSTLPLTPDQRALTAQQIATFWATPPLLMLVGALERGFALCLHLAMSVIVLQAFRRNNQGWLALAILWHGLVDGLAVYAVGTWGVYSAEVVAGIFALAAVGVIWKLRDGETPARADSPAPGGAPGSTVNVTRAASTPEPKLDDTRYTG